MLFFRSGADSPAPLGHPATMIKKQKRSFLLLFQPSQAAQDDQTALVAAKRTIAALMQEISNAQQSIDSLYQQNLKVKTISQEIAQLSGQMEAIKTQAGVSSLEDQLSGIQDLLNEGAINIWARSIDPSTNVNLNRRINDALNEIFLQDIIVKEKINKISMLKREITERIAKKGWAPKIQQLGRSIEKIAPNETNQASQALLSFQAAKIELINTRNNNPTVDQSLLPLEIETATKRLHLKNIITQAPHIHQQLFQYNNELKKLHFILDIMSNVTKAITITPQAITNLESSFNDAII